MMRKLYTICLMGILLNMFSCIGAREVKPVSKLTFGRHGCSFNSGFDIDVKRISDDEALLKVRHNGHSEYDSTTVDRQAMEELENIIHDNRIESYRNRYTPIFEVLDGESWSLTVIFADEKASRVSSHGENAWPSGDGLKLIREWAFRFIPSKE